MHEGTFNEYKKSCLSGLLMFDFFAIYSASKLQKSQKRPIFVEIGQKQKIQKSSLSTSFVFLRTTFIQI